MLRKLSYNGFKFLSGLIYHNSRENAMKGLKIALKRMFNHKFIIKMKKNITKLDISIKNGINKVFGTSKLTRKEQIAKDKTYQHACNCNIKSDNFKAKLLNFLATERGKEFVRVLPFRSVERLFYIRHKGTFKTHFRGTSNDYIVPFELPFKSRDRNLDCIKEVLVRARIGVPEIMGYEKWLKTYKSAKKPKWKDDPYHPQPKLLTKGKVYDHEKILSWESDPRLPELEKSGEFNAIRGFGTWVVLVSKKKYRIPSEQGQIALKIQHVNHMDADQYLVQLENHKMEKWVRKHPKPTNAQKKQDLFPKLMDTEWNTREHNAREFIRNNIRAKYDKTNLPIIGRFDIGGNKWEERIIGYVRDYTHLADHINDDYYGNKMNPILKKAYDIFDAYYEHHPNMSNGYIQNAEKTIGRVLLPSHKSCLQLTLNEGAVLNMTQTYSSAA